MRVFFDNCVSPRLARALHAFHEGTHEVVCLRDKFKHLLGPDGSLSDEVWLELLARESREDCDERAWIVITEDQAILSKTARGGSVREAWERAGLRTFFLPKGAKKPPLQQMLLLLRQWERILEYAGHMNPSKPVQLTERGGSFKPLE